MRGDVTRDVQSTFCLTDDLADRAVGSLRVAAYEPVQHLDHGGRDAMEGRLGVPEGLVQGFAVGEFVEEGLPDGRGQVVGVDDALSVVPQRPAFTPVGPLPQDAEEQKGQPMAQL
ncbi:hypothetical protein [Streptomyces sp. NPDC101165]|uniref:hypothetical protein n=1 Tax=Streptomyces sp. NPDC101165 TaxID=3366119 RepID=UPI003806AED8